MREVRPPLPRAKTKSSREEARVALPAVSVDFLLQISASTHEGRIPGRGTNFPEFSVRVWGKRREKTPHYYPSLQIEHLKTLGANSFRPKFPE